MSWSRTCSRCGVRMPRAALRCGDCKRRHDRERLVEWRRANPAMVADQQRRSNRRRYLANPERVKARVRARTALHREAVNEYARAWRAAHPEKVRTYQRKVRARDPLAAAERVRRRQARVRAATVERIDYVAVAERDGWRCALCGAPVDPSVRGCTPMSVSIDHIVPIARGGAHAMANVQLAHFGCNARKGAR